jgi:hypothetical protein
MFLVDRGIRIDIIKSRVSGTAPLILHLNCENTRAPGLTGFPWEELHYEWDFGGITGDFTYGVKNHDKNKAFGPLACPLYEEAGTYTITLTVTHPESGTVAIESFEVEVDDPDDTWAGTKTVCINPEGDTDFSEAPTDALEVQEDDVKQVILTYADAGDVRILWKRGCSFTCPSTTAEFQGTLGMLGAYGTGEKPIFVLTNNSTTVFNPNTGAIDWRICDIEIDCMTNSVTSATVGVFDEPNSTNVLYKGLKSRGQLTGISCAQGVTSEPDNGSLVFVYECDFVNDYTEGSEAYGAGFYTNTDAYTNLIGNDMGCIQNVGGWPVRLSRGQRSYNGNNQFRRPGPASATFIIHASTGKSEYIVFTDNYVRADGGTGGSLGIGVTSPSPPWEAPIEHLIIDSNWIESVWNVMAGFSVKKSVFRNNIVQGSRTTGINGVAINWTGGEAWHIADSEGKGHGTPGFLWIYNNTFHYPNCTSNSAHAVNLNQNANYFTPPHLYVRNNLYCAPNTTGTPMTVKKNETAGIIAGESNNSSTAQILSVEADTLFLNGSGLWNHPTDYMLKAGGSNYAIGGGTEVPVYDDAAGVVRAGGTYDLGAYQYVP